MVHRLAFLLFATAGFAAVPVAPGALPPAASSETAAPALFEADFRTARYGGIPDGWRDLINERPSRNWAVDGNGFLRPMLKLRTGLLVYDGYTADVKPAHALADARLVAEFKKTEDEAVSFGIAGRVVDRDNYYLARFSGTGRLELLKVKDGKELALDFAKPVGDVATRPTGLVTLQRYREGERWKLSLTLEGDRLTAAVFDAEGREQARLVGDRWRVQARPSRPALHDLRGGGIVSHRGAEAVRGESDAGAAREAQRRHRVGQSRTILSCGRIGRRTSSTRRAKRSPQTTTSSSPARARAAGRRRCRRRGWARACCCWRRRTGSAGR